jgi:phosphoglycolate phosphatase
VAVGSRSLPFFGVVLPRPDHYRDRHRFRYRKNRSSDDGFCKGEAFSLNGQVVPVLFLIFNPPGLRQGGFLFLPWWYPRCWGRNLVSDSTFLFRAVIFDCDGVMFDSKDSNVAYYNHILNHFGYPPMGEEDHRYIQMATGEQSVRYLFRNYPEEDEAEAYRRVMDYTQFLDKLRMEPGLDEILFSLKGRVKLAVATNRSTTIHRVLDHFGLSRYFDLVLSSFDVKRPKPDPECLETILDTFFIRREEALYVGDSEIDAETASAAQVPFAAFKNASLRASFHVRSMVELAAVLSSGRRGV